MYKIIPYLTFNGNCEEAMNFYKDALDGEIEAMMNFEGAPMEVPEDYKSKVMHSTLKAGDLTLMASDSMPGQPFTAGNNISLSLNFDNEDDQKKTFDNLSAGGNVTMPLQDTFWGAKFGMCTDKFGINWMFNHDRPEN
ncbi:MAG: VOC family protein [Ignavibacteriae bacterium]|nr:VOC family protein [Ignavibacteriota bacterium]